MASEKREATAAGISPLEHALRQYRRLVPQPTAELDSTTARTLNVWIQEDVCPVLEDFSRRPMFREYASWPLQTLAPGSRTEERRQVEKVDAALVSSARTIWVVCSRVFSVKEMRSEGPARLVLQETVRISAGTKRTRTRKPVAVDELPVQLAQIREIRERRRDDLVDVRDYFEPRQINSKLSDGQWIQHGEAIVSLNPELLPVGNFVVRRLLQRVKQRIKLLQVVHGRIVGLAREKRLRKTTLAALQDARENLDREWRKLDSLLAPGPEMQLRDTCIALVQVYAAFHPDPDLEWLGLTATDLDRGILRLRHRIGGSASSEIFDRVAFSLTSLERLYPARDPALDSDLAALEEAISNGCLVIDIPGNRVFWEGRELAINLKQVQGRLLLALAEKARFQADATVRDVYVQGSRVTDSAMSTAKDRLMKALRKTSLSVRIVRGRERASYQLDLEPHRIFVRR